MKPYYKKLFVAALVVTTALMIFVCDLRAQEQSLAAFHPVISSLEGRVEILGTKYSIWEPATVGMLLLSGDTIRTTGGSSAEIQFLSGKVRLYENSVLIIPSIGIQDRKKDVQDMVLEEGNVLFDINPLGVRRQFEFRTKNIQGGVKGTVFNVRYLNDGTTVSVLEGTVWVSAPDRSSGKVKVLKAGKSLRVEKNEKLEDALESDCSTSVDDYDYNVPSGLISKDSVPSDFNANPDNNGVRSRPSKDKDK
jgi:hypothetical protein